MPSTLPSEATAGASNQFGRAMKTLKLSDEFSDGSAAALARQLADERLSALSIFRSISELTRTEALEVLVYLTFHGLPGIPAAVRIAATLRSHPIAWETLLRLIPDVSNFRDLALIAISFGSRARFYRDWSGCTESALKGNDEARLTMAALMESRRVKFNRAELLKYEGMPAHNWCSQEQYGTETPSLGRELAWCALAARHQLTIERSRKCEYEEVQQRYSESEGWDWLQEAEPGNVPLNGSYFRMFDTLIPKRKRASVADEDSMEIDSNAEAAQSSGVEFAVTSSVLKVFYEFSQLSWRCKPILIEGPHGCGKSATIAKLAHVTFTGRNAESSGKENICFVHMDTVANKEDSTDFSSLVGTIVPLPEGNGFRWRHGPIGHAIVNGSWLVLENMDCDYRFGNSATSALVSQLTALRPGDEFTVASRSEPLRVGVGFRLFATRTLRASDKSGMEPWTPPGGWESWDKIHYPSLSEDEQLSMLRTRFPSVSDCVPRVLRAISGVQEKLSRNGKVMDREPTFREAVSICERLVTARQLSGNNFTPEAAMLECLDILVLWAPDMNLRERLTAICTDAWSLPPNMGNAMLRERDPGLSEATDSVKVGRFLLSKSATEKSFNDNRKLALTKHTSRTLERIATCISVGESVLLTGETGTGKTSTLQELARLARKELVIVNMSKQSDISDLIGGFRPLEVAAVLPELVKRFEEAFCRRMSSKKNARFFDALHRAARSQKLHKRALLLVQGAIDALPPSIRSSDKAIALEWNRIERMVNRLRKLLPRTDSESSGGERPRKRQRNSSDSSDDETSRINFEYADGALVSALRAGHWLLLDEINLAPVEVLDHLVSLIDHGMVIVPNEEGETVHAADGFALFAAMNPPTDFGKRPLSKELRSRLTEFYIEDIDDQDDLELLIAHRLFGVDTSRENSRGLSAHEASIARDVALFYLSARDLARTGVVDDSSGKCARFSLRTLSYMLSFVVNLRKFMQSNNERRALYEGACFSFATPLPRAARAPIIDLAQKLLLQNTERKKQKKMRPLTKVMNLPETAMIRDVIGFPVEILPAKDDDANAPKFIVTSAVSETLVDVCRALVYGVERVPILLQGPTSAGKTSLVSYLAHLTGNKLIRINNHEHTDLSEYLGCYVATESGSLQFREGPLVRAVREGHWIVLDELNLAPPEVLESLNRLLDDNKEIRIPETGEVIKAHPNFTLFATQNPPGIYGGRKELSRAFRGRFIEIQVDELPDDDLIEIIEQRCQVPASFAKRMVAVMRELQTRRRGTRLFSGKGGFVTARDMFRWGARKPSTRQDLAIHGYFLLGERARNATEREIVRDVIISKVGVDADLLTNSALYGNFSSDHDTVTLPYCGEVSGSSLRDIVSKTMAQLGVALTPHMMRMITLLIHCAANNEPALLVGPTGTGKTTACNLIATMMNALLLSVNCHQHTESSDLVGSFRPCRRQADKNAPLFEWVDGPLVNAMTHGHCFLMDEINMADDAVVERLNAVLESSRTLMLSEKSVDSCVLVGHPSFRVFATMNPSGDFGKKELSPALRNRFTEIWIPAAYSVEDFLPVIQKSMRISNDMAMDNRIVCAQTAVKNILVWMSELDSSRSQFRIDSCKLSLRDVKAWSTFIYEAMTQTEMNPMLAFAHGARLVFLDGISISMNSSALKNEEAHIWERVLQEVPPEFRDEARHASFNAHEHITVHTCEKDRVLRAGPFHLSIHERPGKKQPIQFCTNAPCTRRNFGRLVRAMCIDHRPILMEGPPGAGKTSIVKALASMVNVSLSRVNLSESTEMSDLIGGDVPGPSPGSFCFRQGELLRAMELGKWVLLDEMNLASQSVLEGLNSLLDHRRSVFVPELATEVVAHPNFRIFAAQNPVHDGCGRRGLPQSFLNRFVKVSIEAPSDADLLFIATESFPKVDGTLIEKVVNTVGRLRKRFRETSSQYHSIEFGLRQVLRWCSLLADCNRSSDFLSSTTDPELCFDVVVLKALQGSSDRDAALAIFYDEFCQQQSRLPAEPSIRKVCDEHVRIGKSVLSCGQHLTFDSLSGLGAKVDAKHADSMQAMSIVAAAGWPCIVSGTPKHGSVHYCSQVVESLAALSGERLFKVKGGAFLDVDDLLGGYTQQGLQAEFEFINRQFVCLHRQLTLAFLSDTAPSLSVHKELGSIEKLISSLHSTTFSDIGQGERAGEWITKNFEDTLRVIQSFQKLDRDTISCSKIPALFDRIENLRVSLTNSSQRKAPSFTWEKSELVQAIERGDWILFEDANHCSSAVLDRLNPLLEISNNSAKGEVEFEPLMLPEAPANADGSCASITPNSSFRIFFVLDNGLGSKLSRAIVDRSVTVCLSDNELGNTMDEVNISYPSNLENDDSSHAMDVSTSSSDHRDISSYSSIHVPSIGVADFDLTYEDSMLRRDAWIFQFLSTFWKFSEISQAIPLRQFSFWQNSLSLVSNLENRIQSPDFSGFNKALCAGLVRMFVLRSTSAEDFWSRCSLLSFWFKLVPGSIQKIIDLKYLNFITLNRSINFGRTDLCIDPVYGLDTIRGKEPGKGLNERVKFRFDVIVLSELTESSKSLLSDLDARTLQRDVLAVESQRQSILPQEQEQHRTSRRYFVSVAFQIVKEVLNLVSKFYSFLEFFSRHSTEATLPDETYWIELFLASCSFVKFVRTNCKSPMEAAYGMLLIKLIHDASLFLVRSQNSKLPEDLGDVVSRLVCICEDRPKYETVIFALPMSRNEYCVRTEREILSALSRTNPKQAQRSVIAKALVNLSTLEYEVVDKFENSMKRLLTLLRKNDSQVSLADQQLSIGKSTFPIWFSMLALKLELSSLQIEETLRELGTNRNHSSLVGLSKNSSVEFSLNPYASVFSQTFVQRMAWALPFKQLSDEHSARLHLESRISRVKCSIFKLQNELDSNTADYLFASCSSSSAIMDSLVSCARTSSELNLTNLPRPEDATAVACSFVAGDMFSSCDQSTLRRSLVQLLLCLVDMGIVTRADVDDKSMLNPTATGSEVMRILNTFCGTLHRRTRGVREGWNKVFEQALTVLTSVVSNPHALSSTAMTWVCGFLSIIVGTERIFKFSEKFDNLAGVDPSTIAAAEVDLFSEMTMKSVADSAACQLVGSSRLGGDDVMSCIPKLRADDMHRKYAAQLASSNTRIISRPADFSPFSEFVSSVPRFVGLVSNESTISTFLGYIANRLMSESKHIGSEAMKSQIIETVKRSFELSATSLEPGGDLGHFRDLGGTLCLGIREVQNGALFLAKAVSADDFNLRKSHVRLSGLVSNLLRYPRAAFLDSNDTEDVLKEMKACDLDAHTQADILRYFAFYSTSLTSESNGVIGEGFSNLVSLWKRSLLKEESENEMKNSLFVVKEKARMESAPGMNDVERLEIDEERDYEAVFSTDVPEVEYLVSGETPEDTNEGVKREEDEGEEKKMLSSKFSLEASTFWKYHREFYENRLDDAEDADDDRVDALFNVLRSVGLMQNYALVLSDPGKIMGAISACMISAKLSPSKTSTILSETSTYNFYKDNNSAEVSKMKTALTQFIDAIAGVQAKHFSDDGDHPALSLVSETAERALKATSYTSSLGTLVSVLETVLRKADEWERLYATKQMSLSDEVKELSKIALRWRHIEVRSWPNLLKSREELCKQRAEKWFYRLYDSLVRDRDEDYEFDLTISTMDQFLRSSPQGEFEMRIRMMQSLSNQLCCSSIPQQVVMGNTLSGLCQLYSFFLEKIENRMSTAKEPIKKKMADFSRITNWEGKESLGASVKLAKGAEKELEYARLKSKSEKVRRKLHKLCRELDVVYNASSFHVISNEITKKGSVDLLSELPNVHIAYGSSKKIQDALQGEFVASPSLKEISCLDVSILDSGSRLARCKKLMERMKTLANRPSNISKLENAANTCSSFREQIRSRALDLRNSDSGILVKKRAFVDLLKALEKAGVSPFENPDTKFKEKPVHWLGLCSPFRQKPTTEVANQYFFYIGNRLQRLRAVSDGRVRNADITPGESNKTIAYSCNLFIRSSVERERLSKLLSSVEKAKVLATQLAGYQNSSACGSVKSALNLQQSIHRIERIQADFGTVLGIVRGEHDRLEKLCSRDARTFNDNKYALLSAKRNISGFKEVLRILTESDSLLETFLSASSVQGLKKYSSGLFLITSDVSEWYEDAVLRLNGLSNSFRSSLVAAQKISDSSLACSLLRPITAALQDSVSLFSTQNTKSNSCTQPSPSGQGTILEKCEQLVEVVLKSTQMLLGTNATMDNDAPVDEELSDGTVPVSFLRQASELLEHSSILSGINKIQKLMLEICELVKDSTCAEQGQVAINSIGCFTEVYLNTVVLPFVKGSASFHLHSLGLLKTLTSLFISLSEDGYCRPPEEVDGPVEDDVEMPDTVDGVGFGDVGDGDASMAQDVSAEVEDEEQLLGLQNEPPPQEGENKGERDANDETGVEMQNDFDGELEDKERPEADDQNDGSGDEQEDVEKAFGEGQDDNAVEIDERLWDSDGDQENEGDMAPDTENGEIESGKKDGDSNLKGKENSDSAPRPKPQSEANSSKKEKETDGSTSDQGEDGEDANSAADDMDLAEDENEESSNSKKGKPKLPESDFMSDEDEDGDGNPGEQGSEDKLEKSREEGEDESEVNQGKEEFGDDVQGMNDDDAMMGDATGEQGDEPNSEGPDEKGTRDSDDKNELNDEVMNDLEMEDAENEQSNHFDAASDVEDGKESESAMDDLPPEKLDQETELGSNAEDEKSESADENQPAISGDTGDQNTSQPDAMMLDGGVKTTPGNLEKQNVGADAQMFSNPDGTGADAGSNENMEVEDPTQDGNDIDGGDIANARSQMEQGQTAASHLSLEEFDAFPQEHDPNPFRENFEKDIGEEWEKCLNVLESQANDGIEEKSGGGSDEPMNDSMVEFANESTENKKAALGPATEEQHRALPDVEDNESEDEKENTKSLDAQNQDSEAVTEMDTRKSGVANQEAKKKQNEAENKLVPSEDVTMTPDTSTAENLEKHPLESAIEMLEKMSLEKATRKQDGLVNGIPEEQFEMIDDDNDDEASLVNQAETVTDETNSKQPKADFSSMWRKLERLTESDSIALSEQLRLVLEPTVRAGLAGSFKTGKRLDMKKVIDFVASDFRRDRIWLRRVRPTKRSYDVLVAIDNSKSMTECGAGAVGLAGLVLLTSALAKLEVGRVGILKFGADCEVVRGIDDASRLDETAGADVLSKFSFQEEKTNFIALLDMAHELLEKAKGSSLDEDVQLLFVISDGKLSEREELQKRLRRLGTSNVLVAFIVVNSNESEESNIFNVKQVSFGNDGKVKFTPYMSEFPFRFYTVIHDVKQLPNVLGDALRQWLELTASNV